MDTLYQLLEWNPVQVGSTFQGGGGDTEAKHRRMGGVVTRRRNDGGGERVTRAYTVEVQTTSVFYAQSLILLAS